MRNPLYKRIPKEIRDDLGKNIAIFIFLVLTIGFVSGFIVANYSMQTTYDESFDKYNIEDGHMETSAEIPSSIITDVERHERIKLHELFYKEMEEKSGDTFRIYRPRRTINKVDLQDGRMPNKNREIAIDRLYAKNNNIKLGDRLNIDGRELKVTGLIAASDYSALFKNSSEFMFDANSFSIAIMSDDGWDSLNKSNEHYCYAWSNKNDLTKQEQVKKRKNITKYYMSHYNAPELKLIIAAPENQAISFTGNDFGRDLIMIKRLLNIIIVLLAFIFAVTARNKIEREASVIGTLLASGYTYKELRRHYIILPLITTFVSAIIGNILGYTVFKSLASSLYYESYSLPTYVTKWSSYAFFATTLIPCVIILLINYIVTRKSLRHSPLDFLRGEITKSGQKNAFKLPNWKFIKRFRSRVIISNWSTYLILFLGIMLATILIMFGNMFSMLLKNYRSEVVKTKIADYQYVLKAPVETDDDFSEKYAVTTLLNKNGEKITVYGINTESKFFKEDKLLSSLKKDEVLLSDSYMDKYDFDRGDTLKLHAEFENKKYSFSVKDGYDYPASLCVFMPIKQFNYVFDKNENYFNGYFSDKKIDIDENFLATVITKKDMTLISDQLEDSMGNIFYLFSLFSSCLFMLAMYLLLKIIIERNSQSISLLKILGYSSSEIHSIYSRSNLIVFVCSLLISVVISARLIKIIYYHMMMEFNGWLTYYLSPKVYLEVFVISIICYLIVNHIIARKIKKIDMSEALKGRE